MTTLCSSAVWASAVESEPVSAIMPPASIKEATFMWNSSEVALTTAVSTKTEYSAMVMGLQFDNLHEF